MGAEELVTLADIQAAQKLLSGIVRVTPLDESPPLAARLGGPVYLKCENKQRTGSFKIRGAYTRIARLSEADRARGVVAASAGNHAQGVALAAQLLGIKSTVFMPTTAALPKIAATKGYGASVRLRGLTVDDALVAASRFAADTGAILVHPFNHPDIVAGQGTTGLEILEACPEVATIVVATGGGGLLSGIAAAVKAISPHVRVVGVQAEGAAAFPDSLAAGQPVALAAMTTIADGIAVGRPGEVTLAHVRDLVDDVVTVSDEDITRALLLLLERSKAGCRAGRRGGGGSADGRAAPFHPTGGRGALRRQHRPVVAASGHRARHGRGRSLPLLHGPVRRPARLARRAAHAGRRRRRERPRRLTPAC